MADASYGCDEDIDSCWSTQATQGSDIEEEDNARIDRQPTARYPISEADFVEFFKLENQRHRRYIDYARRYRVENPDDFCAKCRLNVKYTQILLATYAYEALVITQHNCDICGSKEGNCDSLKHRDYHEKICLKI